MAAKDSVVEISEYTGALRRFWPVVLICTILGLLLGVGVMTLQTTEYIASALVEVRPLTIAGDDPTLDVSRSVDAETEQSIASSQRVIELALALLSAAGEEADEPLDVDLDDPEIEAAAVELLPSVNSDTARQVARQTEVKVVGGSKILEIDVVGANRLRAQELAQAIAHAYLDFRRDEGLASTRAAREQLVEREAVLLEELDQLANDIARAGDGTAEARALSYREVSKREELVGIGAKLANIDSISVDAGVVLDDAGVPTDTTGLPFAAGPLFGLLIGLSGGLGIAYLLDRRDDRVRSRDDSLDSLGVPILGGIPGGSGAFRKGNGSSIVGINSKESEAYRRVQGSLLFNLDQLDKSMVLVAGTNNPHSSTTIAANLAVAAARSGRRTLLIGADLRRPSLHDRFEIGNAPGLSDVLNGTVPISEAVQSLMDVPNLQILTAGSPVAEPARLLQGQALGRLVSSARDRFDLVVFEAPPILQVADAVDLARLAEGAVLVVEPNRATRSGLVQSIKQLRLVGADVVGMIVAEPET